MTRKTTIQIIGVLILAIAIGVSAALIGFNGNRTATTAPVATASTQPGVLPTPTPSLTPPTTSVSPTPTASACIDPYGYAPNGEPVLPLNKPIPPCLIGGTGLTPTPQQGALLPTIRAFVLAYATYRSTETLAARSGRLNPYLSANSPARQQVTELARKNSALIGLTADTHLASITGVWLQDATNTTWTYLATGTYVGLYTTSGGTQKSTWTGTGTWTVTVSASDPTHISTVTESIPSIESAP